jgi:hypothetical protein
VEYLFIFLIKDIINASIDLHVLGNAVRGRRVYDAKRSHFLGGCIGQVVISRPHEPIVNRHPHGVNRLEASPRLNWSIGHRAERLSPPSGVAGVSKFLVNV